MYADICISLATLSGSCRAIAGMGDRRALLHLTQSLMEVLQEDEQQWRNLAAAALGVNPPMTMPPNIAAPLHMPMRPMLTPPGPAMPMPYMPHMIAGPIAAPMPRPAMTATPVIKEPRDSPRLPASAARPGTAPMPPAAPAPAPPHSTHTEPRPGSDAVAAAGNKAMGSAYPAPSDVASEEAAAPTIRVPRYATKSSSAESTRPATGMPATKARAFSPPPGLGSSLSWLHVDTLNLYVGSLRFWYPMQTCCSRHADAIT